MTTSILVTLTAAPGLPQDDELTYSVMDGMTETYLRGLQEYMQTLGINAGVNVSVQRMDYVEQPIS